MIYFAIIEKEPGSLWSVYFPDIDGCIAAADTMELASEQAISALRVAYLDAKDGGTVLPEPRSLEAVMEIFAEGGGDVVSILAVPLLENSSYPVHTSITIPADILAAVDEAASLANVTRSSFIALAVSHYLKLKI